MTTDTTITNLETNTSAQPVYPPTPAYLQIEPVGQCNLECQMCAIQFRQDGPPYGPPAFMAFETFTAAVDQFTNLKELHLQGLGEPFMHPRFFDMITYAVQKGIRVTTNSNLTLLNPKRAEACVRSGLDTLHISIDGSNAATYETIRKKGHFKRVLDNLELIRLTKNRLGSETPHLKLVMVLMRQNLAELPEIVELAAQSGMEEVFVQHLSHDFGEESLPAHYKPMRDFVDQQTLLNENLEHIQSVFNAAHAKAAETGITLRLPRPRPREYPAGTPGMSRCSWPWTGAYLSYQGLAMPCCMVSTPDRVNFGSVTGPDGVNQVWNSPAYQQFREALASDNPPDICKSCAVYQGMF